MLLADEPELTQSERRRLHSTQKYADAHAQARAERYEQIRELVLVHRRFDILAKYVLDYHPQPFHVTMLDFQDEHDEGILLGWRGAAKTTYASITRIIGEILCDPDIRILLASDAAEQSKTILRGVKNQFLYNKKLREIFGDWTTGAERWAEHEITTNRRTSLEKEATVTAIGTETVLPVRHFDLILGDDICTKDNTQTPGQRKKVFEWFYDTLLPTLEPKNGRIYIIGTRWHEEDLYQWLLKEDYRHAQLTLPVLDENDRSVWEEMFPTEKMHRIRKANLRAFMLQYMCRAGELGSDIFTQDHFAYYDELPGDVFWWQGVDPAIAQKDTAAFFAHVTIAMDKVSKRPYLIDFREARFPFPKQLKFIANKFDQHPSTIKVCVESNAFQLAVKQQMRSDYPHVPIKAGWTTKDKVARANQLAAIVGEGGIMIRRGHHKFLRRLCALPGSKEWDLFDAFSFAVLQGLRGVRKRRDEDDEPGLI